jgi:MFS family permease
VLALLVLTRASMALHFQALPPIAPFLIREMHLSYAQLGLLIGVFLLPGVFLALPGGLLGARFGGRAVMLSGLVLMTIGALATANSLALGAPFYPFYVALAGRLVGGMGGVVVNVQLTKAVTDWFSGREIATAMSIQLSGWPFGIALALASLGGIALGTSWQTAIYCTAVLSGLVFLLMFLFYRDVPAPADPAAAASSATASSTAASSGIAGAFAPPVRPTLWNLSRREFSLIIGAGLVWLTWNVGYISLISFGALMLISQGHSVAEAGLLISLISWITLASGPLASYLIDRTGRVDLLISVGALSSALIIGLLPLGVMVLPLIVAMGVLRGPCAGGINTLPNEVLRPESRNAGFGVYFTVYYGGIALVPLVAGSLQDLAGTPAAPVLFAGVFSGLTVASLLAFRRLQWRLS